MLEIEAGTRLFSELEVHALARYSSYVKKLRIYHSHPDILGGKPVFVGTRVPIQSLFDHLEAGDSIDDFLEGFPSVTREQVIALLEESRQHLPQAA